MNDTAQEITAVMTLLVEHEVVGVSLLPVEQEQKTTLALVSIKLQSAACKLEGGFGHQVPASNVVITIFISNHIKHCNHLVLPVDLTVGVHTGTAVPVGAGVIILHSTWEGSGLHFPSLPHVALRYNGTSPGC